MAGWLDRFRGLFSRATVTPQQRIDRLVEDVKTAAPGPKRADAWQNILSRMGTRADPRNAGEIKVVPVENVEAQAIWRADDIGKRVIEMRPRDGMRRGYEVKLDKKEDADNIQSLLEDLRLNHKFMRGGWFERAYGGGALFPVLNDSEGDLATELNLSTLSVPKAIHVFEPRQLRPVDWSEDVNDENFGMPSMYELVPIGARTGMVRGVGQQIHHSRLIVFPGIRVSMEQPIGAQNGWGDSVLTVMRDVLRDYNLSWGAAITILNVIGQGVFKMHDLAQLQATDRDDLVEKRMFTLDLMTSILNTRVMDAEDDFQRPTVQSTGVPEILQQMCVRLAAAADTTVTKLMGQSPAGMNATGESDIAIDDDAVASWQDEHLHLLERAVLICAILPKDGPLAGKEPKNWSCVFRPLRQPTEKETADTRLVIAQTDALNIANEVYTGDDAARSHYGSDKYSADITIDWKAREAQKKALEQASQDALAAQQEIAANAANANGLPPGTGAPSNPGQGGDPSAEVSTPMDRAKAALAAARKTPANGARADDDELDVDDPADDADDAADLADDAADLADDDADARDDAEMRADYSADQERDAQGRFGSGGGGADPGSKATGADKAARAVEKAKAAVVKTSARVERATARLNRASDRNERATARVARAHQALELATAKRTSLRVAAAVAKTAHEEARQVAQAKPTLGNINKAAIAGRKVTAAEARAEKHVGTLDKKYAAHVKATTANTKATAAFGKAIEAHGKAASAHVQATAKAGGTGDDRAREIRASAPHANGNLLEAFGNGTIAGGGFAVAAVNPAAQAAIRGHFDRVAATYGLSPRPGAGSAQLQTLPEHGMGGAAGWHTNDGRITLSDCGLRMLAYHAEDAVRVPGELARKGRTMTPFHTPAGVQAYNTMTHETIHDHGPKIIPNNIAHYRMAEELSTEMSARKITADVHGIPVHQFARGGYDDMINGAVGHVARAAGVSTDKAFTAVAKAAIEFKQGSGFTQATPALRKLAADSLKHLGFTDQSTHSQVMIGWSGEADKVTKYIDNNLKAP